MDDDVSHGPPHRVHGCTIKNDSEDNIKVRVSYEEHSDEEDNLHHKIAQIEIPADGSARVGECSYNKGSNIIREIIDCIQVTRKDGHIQELRAPFEGVSSHENDWLFVVNNSEIESVQRIS
jgi:hypothetical protein